MPETDFPKNSFDIETVGRLGRNQRKRLAVPEKVFSREHANRRPSPQKSKSVDGAQEQVEHEKKRNHAKVSTAKYVEQIERIDQGDEFSASLTVLLDPVGIRALGKNRSQKKKNPS